MRITERSRNFHIAESVDVSAKSRDIIFDAYGRERAPLGKIQHVITFGVR